MTTWKMYLYKRDMKNSSVDNACCIFEDNHIFVENLNTSSQSYQPILETVMIKFEWPRGRGAESRKPRKTNTQIGTLFSSYKS